MVENKVYDMQMTAPNSFWNTSLNVLELENRARNTLRRLGCDTIGEFVDRYGTGDAINKVKNCGTKTVSEIKGSIYAYYLDYKAGLVD